jgi:MoaA/NifB/PqqE/SkfB family radical SAM enzyme
LQRVLADVDLAASARLGVVCRTRFGRVVDWAAGDVPCRVEKQPTGRYAYFAGGQRLRGFDGLDRSVLDALRDAQRRLREHDTLWVTLGDQRHRIRLYPVDREHRSHYGALAGREVSVPPADEPGGAPTSRVLEARLAGYLSILKGHQGWLERFLDGLNAHVPVPLKRLAMVTETTFADGDGVVYTDLKLLPTLGCNQRCLFCCAREHRRPFGVQRLRATLAQLSREADLERTKLSFSGGEPTLHPELPALLRYAREIGFPWIGLQTNGVRLSEPALRIALEEVRLQQVIFSFHSHRPETYTRLTRTRGQFPRAEEGLRRTLEQPYDEVLVNIVINRLNVDELPDYADFIAGLPRLPGTRLAIMPSIVFMDSDNGHWQELALPHLETVAALREAVARQPGLFVPLQGDCFFPFCLAAAYPELAALTPTARADSPTLYLDRRAPGPVPGRMRVKHDGCHACVLDTRCGGVCGEYARSVGLHELRPISE